MARRSSSFGPIFGMGVTVPYRYIEGKQGMARASASYRAVRRNAAKKLGIDWCELPRTVHKKHDQVWVTLPLRRDKAAA